ncbi:MAG: class I SAM-dependent methyltransferase [Hyphomicrobiales bacterium]
MPETRINYEACPLCQSDAIKAIGRANCSKHPLFVEGLEETMTWMTCGACTHSFTQGYFNEQGWALISQKSNDNQVFSLKSIESQRVMSAAMVRKVCQFRNQFSGRWLDVGFGSGSLLLTAKEFGYDVKGIDLRENAVAALKKVSIDAEVYDFTKLPVEEKYDAISFCDVLEHIPYPREFLEKARELVNKGGVLFVSCPNFSAPVFKIFSSSNANPYWGEIEHFHNFSKERLTALLAEYGFEVKDYDISRRYRMCMELISVKTA